MKQNRLFIFTPAVFMGLLLVLLSGCASTDERRSTGEYLDDQTLNARVKSALLGDDVVPGRSVSTTTFEGVVQLSGFVESEQIQGRAEEVAWSVAGVRDVINNLEIQPDGVQYGDPALRDDPVDNEQASDWDDDEQPPEWDAEPSPTTEDY